jgi:hypothetical protein
MIIKGISLYPGMGYPLAASLDYLQLVRQAGFSRLFTSLHIPEADNGSLLAEFRQIAAAAVALGFSTTADISPRTFRLLDASLDNLEPIRALGIDALRLDFGFSPAEIAYWTRASGFTIELNASTIDPRTLDAILAAGADVSRLQACHNYYPRPETGLSWELFCERCLLFREHGIAVATFIPSLRNPRGPLAEGLPTLERHRRLNPLTAAKQLAHSDLVDAIFFGDPLAGAEVIQAVGAIQSDCIELRVTVTPNLSPSEREILFANHDNRTDPGEWVVRSATSRGLHAGRVPPRIPRRRSRGSVTVDNANYLRYMGELQIVRKDLAADERVNVVAEVAAEEMFLIDMIRPGMKFRFVEG